MKPVRMLSEGKEEVTTYAWHFAKIVDGKPVLRDGGPLVVGEWLTFIGAVEICKSGLHASYKAFDALLYAPGPYVTLCEVEDVVTEHNDKLVCRKRRPVFGFDATEVLRAFARECALDVIHLWQAPPVVVQYLETGDKSLRAAAAAAAAAAFSAAAYTAYAYVNAAYAAYAAANARAGAAANAANAANAAYAAANAAYAAYAANAAGQNDRLESMLLTAAAEQGWPASRGVRR